MADMVNTKTVARINQVDIVVIENGEKLVAVAPICDALGVASNGQIERIKSDPILGATHKLSLSVGADGKSREMFTIPFKFVFGWLFRIDSRNVKEEAREAVLRYQLECYNALFNHFTSYADYVEQKQMLIEAQLQIVEVAKQNYSTAHSTLKEADNQLKLIRKLNFEDYEASNRQLKFDFIVPQ